MKICAFISRIDRLEKMKDAFSLADSNLISKEIIGKENLVNQASLKKLMTMIGRDIHVSHVYFGQETCERLMPKKEEIVRAADICAERNIPLSIVFPYVGPSGARAIRDIVPELEKITEKFGSLEVVVNDVAGLEIVSGCGNASIEPVLGRLFSRNKRDPRFLPEKLPFLENAPEAFDALRRTSFENERYAVFLRSLGVRRFGIDALPQGINISRVNGLSVDVYYPWVYVTSGRACHVASITDPERARHVKRSSCGMECRRFRIETSRPQAFYSVARGNAVWMECLNIRVALKDVDRLICEPYIPV